MAFCFYGLLCRIRLLSRRCGGRSGLSGLQFKNNIDLIVKLNGRLLVGFLGRNRGRIGSIIMRTIGLG